MKKYVSLALVVILLISLCSAFSAGTVDDPLISLSYANTTYKHSVVDKALSAYRDAIAPQAEEASAKIDKLTENLLLGLENSQFSSGYTLVPVSPGDKLTIGAGASAIITAGHALISVENGELIDVSTGTVVSVTDKNNPSQRLAKNNIRYFAAESSGASFTCYYEGAIAVDGLYSFTKGSGTAPGLLFTDVPGTYWAADYIYELAERKLVNGMGGTLFQPTTTMTRAMFVTVMGRLAGINADFYAVSSFSDVDPSTWYGPYVTWASQNGIVTGYDDGTFNPNAAITREQMALIIMRYVDGRGIVLPEIGAVSFSDADQTSSWALDAVERAQSAGLITGRDDGRFDPKGTANRAEVCTVLRRLLNSI